MFELAWAHSQIEHRHSDRFGEAAHLYQRLAAHVLFAGSALRADRQVLRTTRWARKASGPSGSRATGRLWSRGSVHPIELHLARELLAAQTYLRGKGLELDLVFLERRARWP